MVTFLSLFLWLMTDVHPVKVAVEPGVASVEIFLDGEGIGVAIEPEWEVECDFGDRLRPHELVAVARDETGRELGRAVQLVNLPRADAEVEIVFEGESREAPTALRVITESAERLEPLAVFVTFDGLMLRGDGHGRFPLPSYDSSRIHIVSAEGYFPEGVTARRDVTFGGAYGGMVATELTAVPVILEDRRDLTTQELRGLLRARGEVLTVAAVEHQGGRVYMVRDHGAWSLFSRLGHALDARNPSTRVDFSREVVRIGQGARAIEEIPPGKDRFYLVVPNPALARGLAIYPIIRPFSIQRWGLPWLATHVRTPLDAVPDQRLADAVAVAGLRAAADGCPRTVVLVVGREGTNHSGFRPAAVREYLKTLHVPLAVWSTEAEKTLTLWGEAVAAGGVSRLGKASRRMLKDLRLQWIVWVEGSHLPHEIKLAENDKGIRLAE
ncbi:MAG: hypothetical protein IFJ97_07890 [Acidobacteria bacterium]|uniref:Uncharacterized protein n=1 Tax=Candidatus Sulfomarinibacter kjeldsenii TaxID=2885994 RepID=A0A8J7CNX0_9BACT|nr:hypothetical protein [Candidatus Sulfomarinibacter kjeldsenii]